MRARVFSLALAAAATLVVLRSLVFVVYGYGNFDSDQAIVGLMAKHLSEGRAFPLFFYGQHYLLGVEAWLAVPWFWALGPTTAALKLSLVSSNVVAAILMVAALVRHDGMRPGHAVVALACFLCATPFISAHLTEAMGGNVEPFLFVAVLWWLRAHPLAFGSVLALGVLTREFTVYVVPVLIAADVVRRRLHQRERLMHWAMVAVAFVAVWQGVQALVPVADINGPGSRGATVAFARASPVANLTDRIAVRPSEFPGRVRAFLDDHGPRLLGAKTIDEGLMRQGHDWLRLLLIVAAVVAIGRVGWLVTRADAPGPATPFGWYLLGVGVVAALAFIATRPVENAPLRYVLLALLAPAGLVALWLAREPHRAVRITVIAVIAIWAGAAATDHVRLARRFATGALPDRLGALAAALEARGVTRLEAGYWRAYRIAFLTRERVIAASTDFVRIDEYQRRVAEAGPDVRRLSETPCTDGEPIEGWFLCPR